jgi:hypothetical protein
MPLAHGLAQRPDLPIPEWLFGWGAAAVLIVSFVALAVLWSRPVLEGEPAAGRRAGGVARALVSTPVVLACRLLGVALLVLVVVSGLAGTDVPDANFASVFVYVTFWVGGVVVSALLGDVLRAFNPWLALGLVLDRLRGGRAPRPYPERLGTWPAAAGLFAFTTLELAAAEGQEPRNVAIATLLYTAVQLAGCARYGARPWVDHGEAFAVYFGLAARLAPFEARDGAVRTRRPLAGLAQLTPGPGLVAVLAVMIGTVTFDGLSSGSLWRETVQPPLFDVTSALLGDTRGEELAALLGMAACVGLVAAFYALGIRGAASVGGAPGDLGRRFVHSLVPIAVVYALAHYLSLLAFDGQKIAYLASDPLGEGWDLFGTASVGVRYWMDQTTIWYLQVALVVAGHVAALALAHDRALVLYPSSRLAVRSQWWMLSVMVGFTTLALWLLAQAGA